MNHIQKLLNEIVEENEDYRKWFSEIENRIIAESKSNILLFAKQIRKKILMK